MVGRILYMWQRCSRPGYNFGCVYGFVNTTITCSQVNEARSSTRYSCCCSRAWDYPQQRMVFAMLKDLVNEVHSADLVSPTLIIIGKVVALSPLWVESSEHDALNNENSSKPSPTVSPV